MPTTDKISVTDGQLLQHFAGANDAESFAALVRRHQHMVFAVCRSLLGDGPDSDDAAQAVMLVLAEKAPALTGRACVAGWLHLTARNIARQIQRSSIRRTRNENQAAMEMNDTTDPDNAMQQNEMRRHLHEALAELPEIFSVPIILHHIEEKSQEQIAGELGVSPGTIASRLNRGREKLRQRLNRAGIACGAGVAMTLLKPPATYAGGEAFVAACTKSALAINGVGVAAAAGIGNANAVHLANIYVKKQAMLHSMTAAAVASICFIVVIALTIRHTPRQQQQIAIAQTDDLNATSPIADQLPAVPPETPQTKAALAPAPNAPVAATTADMSLTGIIVRNENGPYIEIKTDSGFAITRYRTEMTFAQRREAGLLIGNRCQFLAGPDPDAPLALLRELRPPTSAGITVGAVNATGRDFVELRFDNGKYARFTADYHADRVPPGYDRTTIQQIAALTVRQRIRIEWVYGERYVIRSLKTHP